MRKIYIVGPTLLAVFAFCAVAATSAFAADEWLANGAVVLVALPTETQMELALIALEKAGGAFLEEILCSVVFDGTVGPGAAGLVEDLLSLSGEIIGELGMTNEKFLDCEVVSDSGSISSCKNHTLVEFWLDNLNLELELTWKTQIELMGAAPLFLNHFFGAGVEKEVGYEFKCELISGIVIEELCEGLRSASLENGAGGVLTVFNWENPIETEAATCSLLGIGTGVLKGSGVTKLTNGETLSVS